MRTLAIFLGSVLLTSGVAAGSFSGQTILGPLTNGSVVMGDNTNSSDDNDGYFSGGPVFFIWDGGDDVYQLNWGGGDLLVRLSYAVPAVDNDLFLYTPGNEDESAYDSISNASPNEIFVAGASAGVYHVLIDAELGREGAYTLEVIPAPGAGALGLLAVATLGRRRR